mgnify:CR=1 FL=1
MRVKIIMLATTMVAGQIIEKAGQATDPDSLLIYHVDGGNGSIKTVDSEVTWTNVGMLPAPLSAVGVAYVDTSNDDDEVDGNVFILGGSVGDTTMSSAVYHISGNNTLSEMSPMSSADVVSAAGALGNVYYAGVNDGAIKVYDPVADTHDIFVEAEDSCFCLVASNDQVSESEADGKFTHHD